MSPPRTYTVGVRWLPLGSILFIDCVMQDPWKGWSLVFPFLPSQRHSKSICHVKHKKLHKVPANEIIISSQSLTLAHFPTPGSCKARELVCSRKRSPEFSHLGLHQTLGVWGYEIKSIMWLSGSLCSTRNLKKDFFLEMVLKMQASYHNISELLLKGKKSTCLPISSSLSLPIPQDHSFLGTNISHVLTILLGGGWLVLYFLIMGKQLGYLARSPGSGFGDLSFADFVSDTAVAEDIL